MVHFARETYDAVRCEEKVHIVQCARGSFCLLRCLQQRGRRGRRYRRIICAASHMVNGLSIRLNSPRFNLVAHDIVDL